MAAAAACAEYWIHPGVWWIARRLRVERELACDDRVLTAGIQPREYAGHLLELAYSLGGHRAPALAVHMARPRQLEGRMLAVLDTARNRATPALRSRLAGLAITAALVVPLAGAEATVVRAGADSPKLVQLTGAIDEGPVIMIQSIELVGNQEGKRSSGAISGPKGCRVRVKRLRYIVRSPPRASAGGGQAVARWPAGQR